MDSIKKKVTTNKRGYSLFLVFIGLFLVTSYIIHLSISKFAMVIPENIIFFVLVAGLILWGLSAVIISSGFGFVQIMKNGHIQISSPAWVDVTRGVGIILFSLSMIIIISRTTEKGIASLIIFVLLCGCGFMIYKLKRDLNDKMIIADDYLSIDKDISDETVIIKREDLVEIIKYSHGIRNTKYYLDFHYKKLADNEEKIIEFTLEPSTDLHVDRDLIEKYLTLRGYEVSARIN